MKKYIRLLALLLSVLFMLAACGETAEETAESTSEVADGTTDTSDETEPEGDGEGDGEGGNEINDPRYGTAVNIDSDMFRYMYGQYVGSSVDESKEAAFIANLETYVRQWYENRYADCGISDILYNIYELDACVEKYTRKTETLEDGTTVDVDYSSNIGLRAGYIIKTQTEIDPYAIWFEQCREDGINPWLSFRMNDVHYANEQTGHSEFFYTAKKNGWLVGNSRSGYWFENTCTQGSRFWHPYAFDYTVPEVRQHFVDIIDRQLGMYDVYGIELDWQRTIWCFPNDTLDNIQYMDLFMDEVNKVVAKYEEQYGHEIKISARIGRDIEENKYFGFDVVNWAKKDWIDVIIPASYWGATDTDMPVAAWKTALDGYEVDVWAGLECHVMNNSQWQNVPTLAAQTGAYLSAGADKIYLYNLFNDTKDKFEVCASLANALSAAKRSYIVTRANSTPYTATHKEYRPLPVKVEVNEPSEAIVINHGLLDYELDTVMYVGISGVDVGEIDADTLAVMYNGVKCTYRGTSVKSYIGTGTGMGTILCFAVDKDTVKDSTSGSIVFDVGMTLTVNYIELTNGNTRI